MTVLTIHTPAGDAVVHEQDRDKDGEPLPWCAADGWPWPCEVVQEYVLEPAERSKKNQAVRDA